MKWDGEWHITYEVFRDLGAAFGVVLLLIYLLIVGWFGSSKVPLVMMIAIPLSLVGILPGHWMFGAFFTATSMIGFIALAGIMVRNSVLLIDFVNLSLKEGKSPGEAVVEAGAVRLRPIMLTAGTVVVGAFVILFDPIFEGPAIALMTGAFALTLLLWSWCRSSTSWSSGGSTFGPCPRAGRCQQRRPTDSVPALAIPRGCVGAGPGPAPFLARKVPPTRRGPALTSPLYCCASVTSFGYLFN